MEQHPNEDVLRLVTIGQFVALIVGVIAFKIMFYDKGDIKIFWIATGALVLFEFIGIVVLRSGVNKKGGIHNG